MFVSGDVHASRWTDNWAMLREAQRLTAENLPNTGLAVTIDIGGANIDPLNKQEVGRRLALVAEAETYGQIILSSGPDFAIAQFERANVKINFKRGTACGLTVSDGEPIKGFALAGENKKFVWAEAKIVPGDEPAKDPVIVLGSPQVEKPVAVQTCLGQRSGRQFGQSVGSSRRSLSHRRLAAS